MIGSVLLVVDFCSGFESMLVSVVVEELTVSVVVVVVACWATMASGVVLSMITVVSGGQRLVSSWFTSKERVGNVD